MKLKTAQDLEKQVVLGMDTSIRSKLNAVLKMIQSCKNHICLWVFISSYERDLQLIFVQRECVLIAWYLTNDDTDTVAIKARQCFGS